MTVFIAIELKQCGGFSAHINWNPAIPLPHVGDCLVTRLDGKDTSFRVSRVSFRHSETKLDQKSSQVSIGVTLHVEPDRAA